MIELAVCPLHRIVTLFARGRETSVWNRGGGVQVVVLVTGIASHAGEIVVVVDVAICTLPWRHRVAASKQESGRAVVKLGVQPVVCRVAGIASDSKFGGDVIRIRASRIVRLVAGVTSRGHRLELARSHSLVAGVAINGSVRSSQREAIVVILDIFVSDLPASHRVTLLAVRTQLALVNIGVAILAALTNIREYRFHVALRTSD